MTIRVFRKEYNIQLGYSVKNLPSEGGIPVPDFRTGIPPSDVRFFDGIPQLNVIFLSGIHE